MYDTLTDVRACILPVDINSYRFGFGSHIGLLKYCPMTYICHLDIATMESIGQCTSTAGLLLTPFSNYCIKL